jgi:mono/diheme cytochrome c family protein
VSEGIAPAGGPLSTAMPRYALSRSEIAALAAYLKAPRATAK